MLVLHRRGSGKPVAFGLGGMRQEKWRGAGEIGGTSENSVKLDERRPPPDAVEGRSPFSGAVVSAETRICLALRSPATRVRSFICARTL